MMLRILPSVVALPTTTSASGCSSLDIYAPTCGSRLKNGAVTGQTSLQNGIDEPSRVEVDEVVIALTDACQNYRTAGGVSN